MTGSDDSPVKRSQMYRKDTGRRLIDDRPYIFRRICHGKPDRCFWYGDHPLPLCSRCLPFYLAILPSVAVGVVNMVLFDPPAVMMLAFTVLMLLPLTIDGLTQYHGLRESNNMLRAVTGILAGIGSGVAVPFVLYGFYEAIFIG